MYVRDGTCFLHRARRQAEASHLLIVNHALLLSNIAAGGNVLPDYQHLVVDEAHHLEDEATSQFGFVAGEPDITDWLERLHTRASRDRDGGIVGSVESATRAAAQAPTAGPQLHDACARALGECMTAGARRACRRSSADLPNVSRSSTAPAAASTTSA